MPMLAAPGGIEFTAIAEARLLAHLYLVRQTGQHEHPSAFLLLSPAEVVNQFTAKALLSILRQHIQTENHNDAPFRVMERGMFEIWSIYKTWPFCSLARPSLLLLYLSAAC